MISMATRLRIGLLSALALAAVPQFAIAQQRVRNIWNGMDHEPTPAEVHRGEVAAGIAPTPARQNKTADGVESLYRQLMGKEASR